MGLESGPIRITDGAGAPTSNSQPSVLHYDSFDLETQKALAKSTLSADSSVGLMQLEIADIENSGALGIDGDQFVQNVLACRTIHQVNQAINNEVTLDEQGNVNLADELKAVESSGAALESTDADARSVVAKAKSEDDFQSAVKSFQSTVDADKKKYSGSIFAQYFDQATDQTASQLHTIESLTPKQLSEVRPMDNSLESGNLVAFKQEITGFQNHPDELSQLLDTGLVEPLTPTANSYEVYSFNPSYDKTGTQSSEEVGVMEFKDWMKSSGQTIFFSTDGKIPTNQ